MLLRFHITPYDFLFAHAVYIHSKQLTKGSFGKSIDSRSKTSLKYCFLDSTLNSMGGVLCSAMVREWLRMRKSLVMYY